MYKNFIIALFKIRKKNEERREETEKSKKSANSRMDDKNYSTLHTVNVTELQSHTLNDQISLAKKKF